MGARFVNIDRNTPMLFPVDMREWVPENHLVHFIIDAIGQLDISSFKVNQRGSGEEQYPPDMMLALLIYCYSTERFGSRKIEAATYTDVAVRYICGGRAHPDHSVICDFRNRNKEAFKETFVKVLGIAQEMGHLKKVGGISVDGTKIKANASKHKAVSYKHAKKMIGELEEEVRALLKKAEGADSTPLADGLTIPEEIKLRQERIEKMKAATAAIEERYELVRQHEQAAYEEKMQEREKRAQETGKKPRGKEPKPPSETPPDNSQFNFTDSESRIMKAGSGNYFEQAYTVEAAVDTEGSMLIVGGYVTDHANDKEELSAIVESVPEEVREVREVLADTGFFSAKEIQAVEKRTIDEGGQETQQGPMVYCAVGKQSHHRRVEDLEKKPEAEKPPEGASQKEQMAHRLQTDEGKAKYKKRKTTVETVFGIIKSVIGFRQFHLRGLQKVETEWSIVKLAYNFKRLHRLSGAFA